VHIEAHISTFSRQGRLYYLGKTTVPLSREFYQASCGIEAKAESQPEGDELPDELTELLKGMAEAIKSLDERVQKLEDEKKETVKKRIIPIEIALARIENQGLPGEPVKRR